MKHFQIKSQQVSFWKSWNSSTFLIFFFIFFPSQNDSPNSFQMYEKNSVNLKLHLGQINCPKNICPPLLKRTFAYMIGCSTWRPFIPSAFCILPYPDIKCHTESIFLNSCFRKIDKVVWQWERPLAQVFADGIYNQLYVDLVGNFFLSLPV